MYILDVNCSEPIYSFLIFPMKNIMNTIMIVAPILLIISLTILFTNMALKPDDKKGLKKIFNSIMATVIIFFISVIVNAFMYISGSNLSVSKCWNEAHQVFSSNKYFQIHDGNKNKVSSNSSDYEKGDKRKEENNNSGVSGSTAINGQGVERILSAAKSVAERAQREKWTYGASGRYQSTLESSSQHKTTSCANFVSVILQEAGYLSKGNTFWSSNDGTTHWSSKTRSEIEKNFQVINVNYNKNFKLEAGDVVLFSNGLQHTALFAGYVNGKKMWYDGGRGSTKDQAANSVFVNMYRTAGSNSLSKTRVVFRLKK